MLRLLKVGIYMSPLADQQNRVQLHRSLTGSDHSLTILRLVQDYLHIGIQTHVSASSLCALTTRKEDDVQYLSLVS